MRVIRPGKLPQERDYEATCRNCSCVFEFQQKEAKYVSDQRDGDYLHIQCPSCQQSVSVAVRS